MKSTILMISLLMIGVFAVSFALADKDTSASLDAEEIASDTVVISSSEIEKTIDEIKEPKDHKRIGFVKFWRGQGWIVNGEKGRLISGFWAVKKFAKITDSIETDVEKDKIVKTLGRLHIAGFGNYKLEKINDDSSTEDSRRISFNVIPIYSDNPRGKLVLNKEQEYNGLITWNGELSIINGTTENVWDVKFATNVKTMKPKKVAAIINEKRIAKISFWKRLQFWKGYEKIVEADLRNELKENPELTKREAAKNIIGEKIDKKRDQIRNIKAERIEKVNSLDV